MRVETLRHGALQSTYENEVEFNLSESGVHPLRLGELVHDSSSEDALLGEILRYTQTNGTPPLRALIASMYPGATVDHIQVTNGGSEANYLSTWKLVEPATKSSSCPRTTGRHGAWPGVRRHGR
jgi:aspartate/methionine/tyrosine aminotransferase